MMTAYRDEREALHQRLQMLERALGKERGERESATNERDQLAEELAEVRRELARYEQGRPPAAKLLAAVAAGVLLAAGMTAVMLGRASSSYSTVVVAPPVRVPVDVAPAPPVDVAPAPTVEPAPPPEPTGLREQPMRAEIQETMRAAHERMRACVGRRTGWATFRVVFSGPTGRAVAATMLPADFAGVREARCMETEVRKTQVEPFSRPSLTVSYPFVF
jgi:hypothetical protein